jgi:hypothetical protein
LQAIFFSTNILVVLSVVKCPEVKNLFFCFKAFPEAKYDAIYPYFFSACQGFPVGKEFVCCSHGTDVEGHCGSWSTLCPGGAGCCARSCCGFKQGAGTCLFDMKETREVLDAWKA